MRESRNSIQQKQAALRRDVLTAEQERKQAERAVLLERGRVARERPPVDPSSIQLAALVEHRRYGLGLVKSLSCTTVVVALYSTEATWRLSDIVAIHSTPKETP